MSTSGMTIESVDTTTGTLPVDDGASVDRAGTAGTQGTARRIASAMGRSFRRWHRRHIINRTASALGSLDDTTLQDIGLHRSRIYSVAIAAYEAADGRGADTRLEA